jgi:hypothetical protein
MKKVSTFKWTIIPRSVLMTLISLYITDLEKIAPMRQNK